MAGDWIKMQHATPEKPEVMQIADDLDVSENEVLGGLLRFWIWCDNQSRDGHALGVTKKSVERITVVTGLFDAMVHVGWLVVDDDGVHVPNFDHHLSQNAKSRGLGAKRQSKKRGVNVTQTSRTQRDNSVTREEKRREEKRNKNPPNPPAGGESWEADLAAARRIRRGLHPANASGWQQLTSEAPPSVAVIIEELGGWGSVCAKPDVDFSREFIARWKAKHPGRKRDRQKVDDDGQIQKP